MTRRVFLIVATGAALAMVGSGAFSPSPAADGVALAVAANFLGPIKALGARFEQTSGHRLQISSGSTGELYTQIRNGAPFDVLLSADRKTPELLETEGSAVRGTRFTYALGRLALYSASIRVTGPDALRGEFRKLAIANPELAPYGVATQQTLTALRLWDAVRGKLVLGQNIGQTFQFVATGNADLGFVALPQLMGPHAPKGGSRWDVPQTLHQPIEQDAALLQPGAGNAAARAFLDFLRGARARDVIAAYGYGVE